MSLDVRRKTALRRKTCDCCEGEIWVGEKAWTTWGNAHVYCSLDCADRGLSAAAKATVERYAGPARKAA